MKRYIKKEQGSVVVIVALIMVVLLGFTAFVVDYGNMASEKRSLQNAVDAACLAGAQDLLNKSISGTERTNKATATATAYLKDNMPDATLDSITITNDYKKITVTATQAVDYLFAKAFMSSDSTNVSTKASAVITSAFGPCDYALFSGSDIDLLQFTGTNTIIGDVHSNFNVKNAATVSGTVTAVGVIDGKINATNKVSGYNELPMPDLTDVYTLALALDQTTLTSYGATYGKVSGNYAYTFSAEQLNALLAAYPSQPIKITGNLIINGTGINTTGCLIVSGDITFNGSDVDMGTTSSVCLATMTGNITFNGGKGDITGILYAPNGTITLDGNSGILNGSVIADVVNSNGGLTLSYNSNAQNSVPDTKIQLVE